MKCVSALYYCSKSDSKEEQYGILVDYSAMKDMLKVEMAVKEQNAKML